MRRHRIAAVLVSVVALAIVGLFALRYFGIEPARDLVVQRLEAITGREVTIAVDFDLAAALAPTLAAQGVAIANAAWASDAPMVEAERIEIELQLVPLLWQGDVVIDRLALSGAEVLLETGVGERVNWRFEAPAPAAVDDQRRRAADPSEPAERAVRRRNLRRLPPGAAAGRAASRPGGGR